MAKNKIPRFKMFTSQGEELECTAKTLVGLEDEAADIVRELDEGVTIYIAQVVREVRAGVTITKV
jgi:hypothetical protein